MYLHVSTKVTKKIDIGSALFNAIKDENARTLNNPLLDACKAMAAMRADVVNISHLDASLASEDGRRTLLDYHRALSAVHPRLPPKHELQSELTWFDAFDRDSSVSQRHLDFERTAVLYNVAASHAASALSAQRGDTTDDLKQVLHLFQLAAGFFDKVSETSAKGSLTVDMYPESLRIAKLAMLANAQGAFIQVAERNSTSHKVRARLLAGARDICNEIVRRCSAPGIVGSQLEQKLGKSAEALALYYDLEAHSERAFICAEDLIMDERLTRLSSALSAIPICRTKLNALPGAAGINELRSVLLLRMGKLEQDLLRRQRDAQEENDNFHFRTPLERVPPVVGHLSAKASDVSSLLEVGDEDELVAKLAAAVPPQAKGVAAKYAAAAYDVVNVETAKLRNTASRLRDKVTEVEASLSTSEGVLRGAHEGENANTLRAEEYASFSEGMQALVKLKKEGGLEHLREREQYVKEEARKTKDLLKKVQSLLAAEEAEDNRLRHAARGQLSRAASRELNAPYHAKIHQILNALENAARADSFVANQIQEHAAALLRASRVELGDFETTRANGTSTYGDPELAGSKLQALVTRAKNLIDTNEKLIRDFEAEATKDPNEAVGHSGPAGSISREEEGRLCEVAITRNFDALRAAAARCRDDVNRTCETLGTALNDYRQSFSRHANSHRSKTEIYAHFPAAAKYKELLDYIRQGLEYYTKESEVIQQLHRDVGKFVASRENGLAGKFSGMNLGSDLSNNYGQAPNTGNYGGSFGSRR